MLASRKLKTVLWLIFVLTMFGTQAGFHADDQSPDTEIDTVLTWINHVRTQNNIKTLAIDPKLNKVALAHSRNMADHDLLAESGPVLDTPFKRIRSAGLTDINNLVVVAQAPDRNLLHGQLESQENLEKILSPEMTNAGIGAVSGPKGNLWLTIHMTERAITFTRFSLSQSNATPAKRSITIRGNTAYKKLKILMVPPEDIMQDLDLEHIVVPDSNGDFEITLSFGVSTGSFGFEFSVSEEGEYKIKNSFSMNIG